MSKFKKMVKSVIEPCVLSAFRLPGVDRIFNYLSYQRRRVRRKVLERQLRESGEYGDRVQRGAFEGLRYPADMYASCRFEKIVGAYECEIEAWVEGLCSESPGPSEVVHIGAAEGYYATGMALRLPEVPTLAYEADDESRRRLVRLVECNDLTDSIKIMGSCDLDQLAALELGDRPLVVCDIESYERTLLDPSRVSWLTRASVLVELHDCIVPGTTELIRERFSSTHTILEQWSQGLDYSKYPSLRGLPFPDIYALTGEDRPTLQNWFLMQPAAESLRA